MKIYQHPNSSNARRAVITARHLALPVDLVFVDLQKGAQRSAEYLAINPNGKVPTLVEDDGFSLHECYAIMAYLADKSGAATLYPTALRARADVNRWMFWCANEFSPKVAVLNWENMMKGMFGLGAPDEARVADASKALRGLGQILETQLARHAYLCGDTLTLSDFAVACSLMTMVPAKLPLADLPALNGWLGRVQALDAWKATEPPR